MVFNCPVEVACVGMIYMRIRDVSVWNDQPSHATLVPIRQAFASIAKRNEFVWEVHILLGHAIPSRREGRRGEMVRAVLNMCVN